MGTLDNNVLLVMPGSADPLPAQPKNQGLAARRHYRNYAAAQTDRHNENHWSRADDSDANALITADLGKLRNRARYEVRNNTYAKGIVDTLANDIIGPGPRLQILTDNEKFNRTVEERFTDWTMHCDYLGIGSLADQLRLVILQLCESGEALIGSQTDSEAKGGNVGYRLLMIEPDRLATPWKFLNNQKIRDGIEVNELGKPIAYHINQKHPGSKDIWSAAVLGEFDRIDADQIIHIFRQDRPGQNRGVPWLTPALPLFAKLRRYTLAVVQAAETAADLAAVMKTNSPDLNVETDIESMDEIEIPRGTILSLPAGWDTFQFKAEQPSSTYKEFKAEIINEIARCLNMPYNVAAANSAGYNYASGRLDWQVYFRSIRTLQRWIELRVCEPILAAWLTEARLYRGLLPMALVKKIKTQWFWPGTEHVDPQKEANGQKTRLANLTTNLAEEWSRQGKDWKKQIAQRAKEVAYCEELGLTAEPPPPVDNQDQINNQDPVDQTAAGGNKKKENAA